MQETNAPPSSPYRTSDPLELTAELAAKERELDQLRRWKKRSRIGVTIALVVAVVHVAAFSGVLVLRYVPKVDHEPEGFGQTCAAPVPADTTPPEPPKAVPEEDLHPRETPLVELGGEEKLPAIASEITHALYSDPTLARSAHLQVFGRERAETIVRQQLQTLLEATVDTDPEDTFELAWVARPTKAEWAAMTEVMVKVLEKHGVTSANIEDLRTRIEVGGYSVESVQERRRGLHIRASVGLECPESQLVSTPIETAFSRVVRGCGKSAIYTQKESDISTSAWEREQNP